MYFMHFLGVARLLLTKMMIASFGEGRVLGLRILMPGLRLDSIIVQRRKHGTGIIRNCSLTLMEDCCYRHWSS